MGGTERAGTTLPAQNKTFLRPPAAAVAVAKLSFGQSYCMHRATYYNTGRPTANQCTFLRHLIIARGVQNESALNSILEWIIRNRRRDTVTQYIRHNLHIDTFPEFNWSSVKFDLLWRKIININFPHIKKPLQWFLVENKGNLMSHWLRTIKWNCAFCRQN